MFWMVLIVYITFQHCYIQLTHLITDMATRKFHYPYKNAKNFMVIFKFMLIILIPSFSFLITKIGRKTKTLLISMIFAFSGFFIMSVISNQPSKYFYLSVFLLAFYESIYTSSIWPCLSVSIPQSVLPIGYGVCSGTQTLVGVILPIIMGKLTHGRTEESYQRGLYFLIGLSSFAIIYSIFLWCVDASRGGLLNFIDGEEG